MVVLCECRLSRPTLGKPIVWTHWIGLHVTSASFVLDSLRKRIAELYGHQTTYELLSYAPEVDEKVFNMKITRVRY